VSNIDRPLKAWEVARIERFSARGATSFFSAKVVIPTSDHSNAEIPLSIAVYSGLFHDEEEIELLWYEEIASNLGILVTEDYFVTLDKDVDYSENYSELLFDFCTALNAEVIY